MYQNYCSKCGSRSLYTEKRGNNIGLYCKSCGVWQKWLSKNELRTFEYSMRDATKEEQESVDKYVKSISKNTGINFYEETTIIERLDRLIEGIEKEIDCEYERMPISKEDAIRKNTYCFALEKCKVAISKIISGKEFNACEDKTNIEGKENGEKERIWS